jgi:hypothetical protein
MGFQHHSTPKKGGLKATRGFLQAKRIEHFKTDLFQHFKVGCTQGYKILNESDKYGERTFYSSFKETRGRKKTIDSEALTIIERFLENNRFNGRTVPYAALPAAAGLDIDPLPSARTIQRAVGSLDFRFYITYYKQWNSARSKEKQVEFSRIILEKYPNKED